MPDLFSFNSNSNFQRPSRFSSPNLLLPSSHPSDPRPSTSRPTHPISAIPPEPTSSGWHRIGDDDGLYIQSDHIPVQHPSLRSTLNPFDPLPDHALDHPSNLARKRKRTAPPPTSYSHAPTPSHSTPLIRPKSSHPLPHPRTRSSLSLKNSDPALKYDDEGCSNCAVKQSTRWWMLKNKLLTYPHGSEAFDQEKLCNACSIHWNEHGYHRNLKPNPKPTTSLQPRPSTSRPRSSALPSRPLSINPRRSCPSRFPLAPSSPTTSITKPHSASIRRHRNSRSPSQLTLAAEREAQILRRSLAKASTKTENARRKRRDHTPLDDHSDHDELDLPAPPPPSRPKQKYTRASASRSQKPSSSSARNHPPSSLAIYDQPRQSSSYCHPYPLASQPSALGRDKPSRTRLSEELEELPAIDFGTASPPRTPPASAQMMRMRQPGTRTSPGQTCDLDSLLSPSFLNASPNSLLRKLSPQKQAAGSGGSGCQTDAHALRPGASEVVFSPSRVRSATGSGHKATPPVEPRKRLDMAPPTSQPQRLDAHMRSLSSGHSQSSIFSGSLRPTDGARKAKSVAGVASCDREAHPKERRKKVAADLQPGLDGPRHRPGAGPSRRKSNAALTTTNTAIQTATTHKRMKSLMERTIWSRRLETAAASSEDSQLDEHFPGCSGPSDLGSGLQGGLESGLSSAARGMDGLFGREESSPSVGITPSSPVLPPPSDCSEGITPHGGPYSDEIDERRLENGWAGAGTGTGAGQEAAVHIDYDLPVDSLDRSLTDITSSLNRAPDADADTDTGVVQQQELETVGPEVLRALGEAIKAGWSTEKLECVLRNLSEQKLREVRSPRNGSGSGLRVGGFGGGEVDPLLGAGGSSGGGFRDGMVVDDDGAQGLLGGGSLTGVGIGEVVGVTTGVDEALVGGSESGLIEQLLLEAGMFN